MFKLVVLCATLAVVAANPISFWGAGYTRPLAGSWNTPLAAGVIAPLASAAIYTPFITSGPASSMGVPNYRGPLSFAPGQPANILAADGRPLDTLSVNQDRAVHFNAQAVEGNGRRLQKRSIFAPLAGHVNAGHYAGGYLAGGHLVGAGHLAAVPLTLGRSWVGPAPIAPVAAAVAGPLGF